MKKIASMLILALTLGSCSTVYSTMGIASTEYVDEQYAEMERRNREAANKTEEMDREIQSILADLDEMQSVTEELREAAATIEETRAAMEDLQRLAVGVEERMNALSGETLTQLRDILNGYLGE